MLKCVISSSSQDPWTSGLTVSHGGQPYELLHEVEVVLVLIAAWGDAAGNGRGWLARDGDNGGVNPFRGHLNVLDAWVGPQPDLVPQ